MLLKFVRNKRLIAVVPFFDGFFGNKYDKIEDADESKFYNTKEADNITGLQRLKNLFRKHEDDAVHPAITELIQNSVASLIFGGIYGASINSRYTFIKFIENNEATQFRNHLDAKRKLSDAMFMSYIKGFGHWGSKICIFVTVFTATQLTLSVYHNKYAFWHYSAGGATAGALYKFQLGPKGIIAGAVFGGIFGTLYGSIKVLLLLLSNQTEEDVIKFRQSLKDMKDEFDWKQTRQSGTKQIQDELQQAMLDPKAPIKTS